MMEGALDEAGPGQLPCLLRNFTSSMQSLQCLQHAEVKLKTESEAEMECMPVLHKLGKVAGRERYEYSCPLCETEHVSSRRTMEGHIAKHHTKKFLLCTGCHFTTYNIDSLNSHMKKCEGMKQF